MRGIENTSFMSFLTEVVFDTASLPMLLLIVVLGVLNWLIESIKWRYVVAEIYNISLGGAIKSVLVGIFFSMFIPNRAGDFIGRVYSVPQQEKGKLSVLTLLGSYAQLIATLFWGVLGCSYFAVNQNIQTQYSLYLIIFVVITWIVLLFALILFFKSSTLSTFGLKKTGKWFVKIHSWMEVLGNISFLKLFVVLVLSVTRYLVFAFQLWVAYRLVGVDVPGIDLFCFVTVYYLLLTFIPTIVFTEIGVRGSLSIYLFGMLLFITSSPEYDYEFAVSFASIIVWLINIVLPAIVGSFYTYRLKFYNR